MGNVRQGLTLVETAGQLGGKLAQRKEATNMTTKSQTTGKGELNSRCSAAECVCVCVLADLVLEREIVRSRSHGVAVNHVHLQEDTQQGRRVMSKPQ